MTRQEQELVEELFDRLANLENNPRDPAAERLIADGLRRAPHAVYALVQTALVQDEALKRANARIEELQAQLGSVGQEQQQGGFLDSMREAVLGRRDPRSSVPTVRSQAQSSSAPPYQARPQYPPQDTSLSIGRIVSRHRGIDGGGVMAAASCSAASVRCSAACRPGARRRIDTIGHSDVAEKSGTRTRIRIKTTRTRPTRTKTDQDQDDDGGDFGGDDTDT